MILVKIEKLLQQYIAEAVKACFDLEIKPEEIVVEVPKNTDYGDYSTNIAMQLPKKLHKPPYEIADPLLAELEKHQDVIEYIDIAGAGFINFHMQPSFLARIIPEVMRTGDEFGHNYSGHRKTILVEYVSANPTGDLHLGHARNAAWGDGITRLLKASNWDVLREFYINDAGSQMENLAKSIYARYCECFDVEYPIPEDGYYADDVKEIGKQIADLDGDYWLTHEEGRLQYFRDFGYEKELEKLKNDLKYFRVEFDSWVSETWLRQSGMIEDTVDQLIKKGEAYEEDGALWFTSTKYGDDKDRVLRKQDGAYTYFTPDITNHLFKYARGYEYLVNLWGGDHHSYVERMKDAMQAFGHKRSDLDIDMIQMVHLVDNGKEVKMSKRQGNAITMRGLCDAVGVDAARYFFAAHSIESQMDFDINLAKKHTTENPVYYIQYAHARACGILKNAPRLKRQVEFSRLTDPKEVELMKLMNDFPFIVGDAAAARKPNRICSFLMQFAGTFHSYYGACKINDPEDAELTNERLYLVKACRQTLANALYLIGVSAPESM